MLLSIAHLRKACILVPNLFLPLCHHTFDCLCGDWVDSLMSYTLIGLSYLFGFYIDNVAAPGLMLVSKILPYQLHGSSMSEEDIKKQLSLEYSLTAHLP